jgi:hypothetical protein
MTALRDFESDLERAIADLEDEIADIVDVDDDLEDEIIVEGDDGVRRLDVEELRDLLSRLREAPEAATHAFEDFGWKFRKALRSLKQAFVREEATP